MNYVARKYRLVRHVGGVRKRLAEKLIKAFADQFKLELRCDPGRLSPARGAWRTDFRLDVMRWEGAGEIRIGDHWMTCTIESWDRMTDCLRGFTIDRERSYSFLVSANGQLARD